MKIAYITTDWVNSAGKVDVDKQYGGVGYYRAYKPAEYLRKLGHTVDVFGATFKDQFKTDDIFAEYIDFVKNYDIVVIKQADNRHISYLIGACHEAGIPITMDIDDNFFEVFKGQPALEKGYNKGGLNRAYAAAAMSMVDALFVSTKPLKEYFQKIIKEQYSFTMPIFVLPNCNDVDDWQFTNTSSDKFFIGWHGSVTHDEDLKIALPAIHQIMKKNKDVYLQLLGGIRQESVPFLFKGWEDVADRILIIGGTPSWDGFPKLLMEMPFDIAIAPLVDNEFNRGKSHIKWMEIAMKKIPIVASDVEPYRVIKDGKTGFLCSSRSQFRKTIEKLIKDKKLREKVGENAYKDVVKNWQYKDKIHLWEKALSKVKKNKKNIKLFGKK